MYPTLHSPCGCTSEVCDIQHHNAELHRFARSPTSLYYMEFTLLYTHPLRVPRHATPAFLPAVGGPVVLHCCGWSVHCSRYRQTWCPAMVRVQASCTSRARMSQHSLRYGVNKLIVVLLMPQRLYLHWVPWTGCGASALGGAGGTNECFHHWAALSTNFLSAVTSTSE